MRTPALNLPMLSDAQRSLLVEAQRHCLKLDSAMALACIVDVLAEERREAGARAVTSLSRALSPTTILRKALKSAKAAK